MKKTYCFPLAFLLIFIASGRAQNIVSALKDKTGDIWFSVSDRGVYRYDGKSFVHFTGKDNSGGNMVTCLYEDKTGDLWFSTDDKGICKYNGKTFTRFRIPMPDSNVIGGEKYGVLLRIPIQVGKIFQDKTGDYWFLTQDHGVYRYDGRSFTSFLLDETPQCILESKTGELYIGSWSGGGVYRYEEKHLDCGPATRHRDCFKHVDGFSDGMIFCMLEDKTGSIWAGTRNSGADRYDGKSIFNFSGKSGLVTHNVSCIFEDSRGNLWFGADHSRITLQRGDAFRYNGESFTNVTALERLTTGEGLIYNVSSFVEDRQGNIWLGSRNGLLLRYDGKSFVDFSKELSKL